MLVVNEKKLIRKLWKQKMIKIWMPLENRFLSDFVDFGKQMEACWLPRSSKNRCDLQDAIF